MVIDSPDAFERNKLINCYGKINRHKEKLESRSTSLEPLTLQECSYPSLIVSS